MPGSHALPGTRYDGKLLLPIRYISVMLNSYLSNFYVALPHRVSPAMKIVGHGLCFHGNPHAGADPGTTSYESFQLYQYVGRDF